MVHVTSRVQYMYGIPGERVIKLYYEMSPRVEVGCKVKGGSTNCTEVLKTMAQGENGIIMF